jgi:hypothetical protein
VIARVTRRDAQRSCAQERTESGRIVADLAKSIERSGGTSSAIALGRNTAHLLHQEGRGETMKKMLSTVSLLAALGIALPAFGADVSGDDPARAVLSGSSAPTMKVDAAQTPEANKHPCTCDHARVQTPAPAPATSQSAGWSRREPGGGH